MRDRVRRAYTGLGTVMLALGAIACVSLYEAENWSGSLVYGILWFCLVAGIILLSYGLIRRETYAYVLAGAIMIAVVTIYFLSLLVFLMRISAARYGVYADFVFLLVMGITFLAYGLIDRDRPSSLPPALRKRFSERKSWTLYEKSEDSMNDYGELVGKRLQIGLSMPYELLDLSPLYGHVVSQYPSYKGSIVLEVELDQEVDWGDVKSTKVLLSHRHREDDFLSILDGGDMSVNMYVTRYRLTQPPPEEPSFVAVGEISIIDGRD